MTQQPLGAIGCPLTPGPRGADYWLLSEAFPCTAQEGTSAGVLPGESFSLRSHVSGGARPLTFLRQRL
ncbi:hypothetical protein [Anaerolinea thermolimosa]|uniref:hypothetical protein n=1 Tax=Anaerolinea thermolimosa TaxID=229919 RepID=UPI0013B41C59|nr:hypothetical protein [Anaerolinea thermolimosa]